MLNARQPRPMDIGDLLDAAFRLYRVHTLTFLGIVAIAQLPLAALQFGAQMAGGGLERVRALGFVVSPITLAFVPVLMMFLDLDRLTAYSPVVLLLCAAQYLIVQGLIVGALTHAIVRSSEGHPIAIFGAYRLGVRRSITAILAALAPLSVGALGAWLVYPFDRWIYLDIIVVFDNDIDQLLSLMDIAAQPIVLFRLLAGLVALLIYARLMLAPQVALLEGRGMLASVRRSWWLAGGASWRTLALVFAIGLFTSFMIMLPIRAALVLNVVFTGLNLLTFSNIFGVLFFIIFLLGLIPVLPLQIGAQTLLYYDLRMRREGYDLELKAAQAGLSP